MWFSGRVRQSQTWFFACLICIGLYFSAADRWRKACSALFPACQPLNETLLGLFVPSVSLEPVACWGRQYSKSSGKDLMCRDLSRTVHRFSRVLDQDVYSGLSERSVHDPRFPGAHSAYLIPADETDKPRAMP